MQIHSRSPIIYNSVIFILLSFVYLHVCFSLDADVSALDFQRFIGLLNGMPILLGLSFIVLISLMQVWKITNTILSFFILIIFYKTFSLFLLTYNKFLLFVNFIYLVTAYNIILLLVEEMKSAVYDKRYKDNSIDVNSYNKLKIGIINNNKLETGSITNYDKDGFVVKLDDESIKISDTVNFEIDYEKSHFTGLGKVVTSFGDSFGVHVLHKEENATKLGWKEFYSIIVKRF